MLLATHPVTPVRRRRRRRRSTPAYVAGCWPRDWGFHHTATAQPGRPAGRPTRRSHRRAVVAGGPDDPAGTVRDGWASWSRRSRTAPKSMALAGPGRVGERDAVVGGRRRARGDVLMPLLRKSTRSTAPDEGTTLFFATDLHGSEICFKKFVNAARLLQGRPPGPRRRPHRQDRHPGGRPGRRAVGPRPTCMARRDHRRGAIDWSSRSGPGTAVIYTRRMSPEEHSVPRANPEAVEEPLRASSIVSTLSRWLGLRRRAAGRHRRHASSTPPATTIRSLIDDVLREHGSETYRFAGEGEIVEVAPGHEMLSTGWTNHTPWNTHREYTEEAIAQRIDDMAACSTTPTRRLVQHPRPALRLAAGHGPAAGRRPRSRPPMGGAAHRPGGLDGGARRHRAPPAAGQPARPHPRVRRVGAHRPDPGRSTPAPSTAKACSAGCW